jgi:fructose-1,6-bisphosphatase I
MSAAAAPNLDLDTFLAAVGQEDEPLAAAGAVVRQIASAAIEVADLISLGQLGGGVGVTVGTENSDGDTQRKIDILANEIFIGFLRGSPVSAVLSEELSRPLVLDPAAPVALAIDPLDGSSNIDTATAVGTIFSVVPAIVKATEPAEHFLQPGRHQIAAGFVIYGSQTSLVLTFCDGVHVFTLDRQAVVFRLAIPNVSIPRESAEYAINASNYRHWEDSVRAYVDDCVTGIDGPLARNHNMRWIASLVAEAYRILARGGVFLYPADQRPSYVAGRLRLIYEANPISLLIEQAGGAATDAIQRILDRRPTELHARTPFVFGSSEPVHRIIRYHTDPQFSAERAPLFGRRGLMRL